MSSDHVFNHTLDLSQNGCFWQTTAIESTESWSKSTTPHPLPVSPGDLIYYLVWPDEAEVLACLKVEEGGLGAGAIGRLEPDRRIGHDYDGDGLIGHHDDGDGRIGHHDGDGCIGHDDGDSRIGHHDDGDGCIGHGGDGKYAFD